MNDATLELIIQLRNEASAGIADLKQQVGDLGAVVSGPAVASFTALGAIAANIATQIASSIGGAITGTISAAADFESGINNLAAVAGDSLAQAGFAFDDVKAKALELGTSTAYSASQSLNAMTELVKGGVPIADVMGAATEATLNLAAAGGTELGAAAEIVAKQLGVWGETGVTATDVSNLLASAANASTVGVEDLALGLSNVSGTAKTAGVDFDELVQTMGLIAPGFSSAADAGTSLKTFISNLQPTTGPAIKAMTDLGLYTTEAGSAFYDAQGNFVGMEETARILADATNGLSEGQKVMALNTIFGSDAIRAAAGIASAGAEGFTEFQAAMVAAGTAAEIAAIQNQGFGFAFDSLMGSVETLQLVIGGALLPVLTSLITGALIPGVNAVTLFAQALLGYEGTLARLPGPIQTIVTGLQDFFAQAQVVAGIMADGAVQVFAAGWELLQPVIGAVGVVISGIASIIGGVLAGAIGQATNLWGAFTTVFGSSTSAVMDTAQAVNLLVSTFGGPFVSTIAGVVAAWNAFTTLLTTGGSSATQTSSAIQTLAGALGISSGAVAQALSVWQTIQGVFAQAGQATQVLASIFNQLAGQAVGWGANIVNSLGAGIAAAAAGVITYLRQLGSVISAWLRPGSPPKLLPELTEWGTGAATAYMEGWGDADFAGLDTLASGLTTALNSLVDVGQLDQVDVIGRVLGGREAISGALNDLRTLGSVSQESFDAIAQAAGPVAPQVLGLVQAYADLTAAQREVTSAQAELTAVTAEYEATLAPLNAALDANRARQAEIRDMQRVEKLQEDLASGKLSASEAELAQLQIAEIQQKKVVNGVEAERDAAVTAAKAKVDAAKQAEQAAQQQLKGQQALIDSQKEQNALIKEQTNLLAEAAKASAAAAAGAGGGSAGGGGGGGGGLGGMPALPPMPGGAGGMDIPALPDMPASPIEAAKAVIAQELSDAELMAAAAAQRAKAQAAAAIQEQAAAVISQVGALGQQLLLEGPAVVLQFATGLLAGAPALIEAAAGLILPFLEGFGAAREQTYTVIGSLLVGLVELIGAYAPQIIAALTTLGVGLVSSLAPMIAESWVQIGAIGAQVITALGAALPGIIGAIGAWVVGMGTALIAQAPTLLAGLSSMITSLLGALMAALPGIITTVGAWALVIADMAVQALPGLLANLGTLIASVLATVGAGLPGIVGALAAWGAALFQWVIDAAPGLFEQLLGLVAQLLGYIISNAPAIAAQLGEWAMAFVAWVGPAAGQLIGALGEMAGSLFNFIYEQGPTIKTTVQQWGEALHLWVGEVALPGVLSALAGFASEVFGAIGSAAGSVTSKAAEIGKNIVAGVISGIKNAASGLMSAIQGLIGDAVNKAKAAAGIASPSAVFADAVGSPITEGIAQGIIGSIPEAASAAAQAAQEALAAAQAQLGINSPSLAFSEGVGGPIVDGMAEGLMGNLGTLLDAAQEIGGTVLDEATAWADEISAAVGPLIEAGFAGAAQFARTQIAALDSIDSLFSGGSATKAIAQTDAAIKRITDQITKLKGEASDTEGTGSSAADQRKAEREAGDIDKKRVGFAQKLSALAAERQRLEVTARQNIDEDKRAEAEQKLLDLVDKEKAIRQDAADFEQSLADKAADRAEKEAAAAAERAEKLIALEAEKARLEAERVKQAAVQAEQQRIAEQAATDYNAVIAQASQMQDPAESAAFLAVRAKQIEEEAKLQSELAAATTDEERQRLQNKLTLLEIAQQNEFKVYEAQAKARAKERDDALREATLLAEQLGNLVFYSQEDVFGQGEDIMLGIAAGMQSQLGTLRGTLSGLMDQVLAEARAELGIQSPSTVAADLLGQPFSDGITMGIEAGQAGVEKAKGAITDALTMPLPEMAALAFSTPTIAPSIPPITPQVGLNGRAAMSSAAPITINLGPITIGAGAKVNVTQMEEASKKGVKAALDEAGRTGDVRQRTSSR